MEVQGKIILALPEVTGVAKASGNPWKKREYVLETHENFPKKIHFDFFGERADQYPLQVGDEITLFFDIESREYMGRWYTSIRGWKAEKVGEGAPAAAPQPGAAYAPPAPSAPASTVADPFAPAAGMGQGATDDLPF